jgi:hypothetical protein
MKRRGNPTKFSLLCNSRREKFSRFIGYPEFYTEIPRIWYPKWWNVRENVDEKLKFTLRLHPDAIPVVSTNFSFGTSKTGLHSCILFNPLIEQVCTLMEFQQSN